MKRKPPKQSFVHSGRAAAGGSSSCLSGFFRSRVVAAPVAPHAPRAAWGELGILPEAADELCERVDLDNGSLIDLWVGWGKEKCSDFEWIKRKLFDFGYQQLRDDKFDEAVKAFEGYLCLNPEDSAGYLGLAKAQRQLGRISAFPSFDRAIELDPSNLTAWFCRGEAYADIKESRLAVADFLKCWREAKTSNTRELCTKAVFQVALTAFKDGYFLDVVCILTPYLKGCAHDMAAWALLVRAKHALQDLTGLHALCDQVATLHPKPYKAWFNESKDALLSEPSLAPIGLYTLAKAAALSRDIQLVLRSCLQLLLYFRDNEWAQPVFSDVFRGAVSSMLLEQKRQIHQVIREAHKQLGLNALNRDRQRLLMYWISMQYKNISMNAFFSMEARLSLLNPQDCLVQAVFEIVLRDEDMLVKRMCDALARVTDKDIDWLMQAFRRIESIIRKWLAILKRVDTELAHEQWFLFQKISVPLREIVKLDRIDCYPNKREDAHWLLTNKVEDFLRIEMQLLNCLLRIIVKSEASSTMRTASRLVTGVRLPFVSADERPIVKLKRRPNLTIDINTASVKPPVPPAAALRR